MARGRGRGHGGSGGRGRGRGRSRGGSRSRAGSSRSEGDTQTDHTPKQLDIETGPREFFTQTASVAEHIQGQNANVERYAATLGVLRQNGVRVPGNAIVRALVAAWARHDYTLADALLKNRDQCGLVEVLKAVTILDAGRQIRIIEKAMKRYQFSGVEINPRKLGKYKSAIHNLNAIKPPQGSASGAVCKHIKAWVGTFSKEELEFYALHYPKEPWKKLADICHFNPKDFVALPWFLPFCHGEPSPDDSIVSKNRALELKSGKVNELIKEINLPYSHAKQYKLLLNDESKRRLATYERKLDTLLWWYEDLKSPEVDKVIEQRLDAGDQVELPNGKLLERLLTLKIIREQIPEEMSRYVYGYNVPKRKENPIEVCFLPKLILLSETRLANMKLHIDAPVVVIGDASGSMQIAVRTSTIIASLLTAICSSKLVFFDTETRDAPYLPKNITEVLELAVTTQAGGGSTPAASLWPFYERKEVVKTFIIVTDQKENGKCNGENFATLYKKYHDEVYPAKLVFVSFLYAQHAKGKMVKELEDMNFNPVLFRFHSGRPDLRKLENLFGLLSSDSAKFQDEITQLQDYIKRKGLTAVFDQIKRESVPE